MIRGEWKFKGAVVTDAYTSSMDIDRMIRCGNELPLAGNAFGFQMVNDTPTKPGEKVKVEKLNADGTVAHGTDGKVIYEEVVMDFDTQVAALRNACKHILYALSQSNGMRNGACVEDMIKDTQSLGTVIPAAPAALTAPEADLRPSRQTSPRQSLR